LTERNYRSTGRRAAKTYTWPELGLVYVYKKCVVRFPYYKGFLHIGNIARRGLCSSLVAENAQ
jgi:hypothetical protein